MSVNVKQVSTAPDYIMKFINHNLTKLNEIYDKELQEHKEGMLGFKCSKKENKMDVFFMNEELICQMLQKESWKTLQQSTPEGKRLFFVNDLDLNSIFMITI